jgi:uncharacterized membrane protein YcgQ (UPF0703/DUF1980 family)
MNSVFTELLSHFAIINYLNVFIKFMFNALYFILIRHFKLHYVIHVRYACTLKGLSFAYASLSSRNVR